MRGIKFEFTISDEEIEDLYNVHDFKNLVASYAAKQVLNGVYNNLYYDTDGIVKEILKEHKQEIVDKVIEMVEVKLSDSIAKKKEIIAVTPKVSELSKINKENEQYFMELIDKAIVKRFK